jgi:Lar family restriction alleviation protein
MYRAILKNCPFCGGLAELDDDGYYEWAVCQDCGASTSMEKYLINGIINEAIEAWNTRVKD